MYRAISHQGLASPHRLAAPCAREAALRRREVLLHFLLVALLAAIYAATKSAITTLAAGGISVFCIYLWLGMRESKRQHFWLTPLSFFFFWYCIGYGLSAIWAASYIHSEGELPLLNQIVPGPDVASGYLLMLLGAASLHAGYVFVIEKIKIRQLEPSPASPPSLVVWTLAFSLGIVALLWPQLFSFLGLAHMFFELLAPSVLLAFACLDRRNFQANRFQYATCLFAGTLVLFLASVYNGSKLTAMLSLLPMLSAFAMRRRFRAALPFGAAAVAVLYLGVIAPMINESRNIAWTQSQLGRLGSALQEKTALAGGDDHFYSDQLDSLFYRQFEPTAVGFIYSEVSTRGFLYGETMKPLAYAFIPRIVWPQKPVVSLGTWFTAYLGFAGSPEEATTNTGTYAAGEFYWNFGIGGVIAGMFLIGACIATIYKGVGEGPHLSIVAAVFFYIAVIRIVELSSATENIPEFVFVLLALWGFRSLAGVYGRGALRSA